MRSSHYLLKCIQRGWYLLHNWVRLWHCCHDLLFNFWHSFLRSGNSFSGIVVHSSLIDFFGLFFVGIWLEVGFKSTFLQTVGIWIWYASSWDIAARNRDLVITGNWRLLLCYLRFKWLYYIRHPSWLPVIIILLGNLNCNCLTRCIWFNYWREVWSRLANKCVQWYRLLKISLLYVRYLSSLLMLHYHLLLMNRCSFLHAIIRGRLYSLFYLDTVVPFMIKSYSSRGFCFLNC